MNLEKLNGWLNFFGQLAVLGGLIALVVEIRGNSQSLRAQEVAIIAQQDVDRQLLLLDPDARADYAKALFDPAGLTQEELFGASMYLEYRTSTLQSVFSSVQDGILTEADWESYASSAHIWLGSPFGRRWWEFTKDAWAAFPGQEFVDTIDESLKEADGRPDDLYYIELCETMGLSGCATRSSDFGSDQVDAPEQTESSAGNASVRVPVVAR
ncbi:MAG: hypothetical protein AAGG11_12605 [Pseudomonadota bacterium]